MSLRKIVFESFGDDIDFPKGKDYITSPKQESLVRYLRDRGYILEDLAEYPYVGSGWKGVVYKIGQDKVLKLGVADETELAEWVIAEQPRNFVRIFGILQLPFNPEGEDMFAVVMEYLECGAKVESDVKRFLSEELVFETGGKKRTMRAEDYFSRHFVEPEFSHFDASVLNQKDRLENTTFFSDMYSAIRWLAEQGDLVYNDFYYRNVGYSPMEKCYKIIDVI
jgi:hypothetical protein